MEIHRTQVIENTILQAEVPFGSDPIVFGTAFVLSGGNSGGHLLANFASFGMKAAVIPVVG
jgi:hypothetical protein